MENKSFYYTFGTSKQFPFRGGWVKVFAPDRKTADKKFRAKYPDVNKGILNCSFIYNDEQWSKNDMRNLGNIGAKCHDTIG